MKQYRVFFSLVLCIPFINFAQPIFSNAINGVNPSTSNPYVIGQIVDSNITASGIGRGSALFPIKANNRYNAKSWKSDNLDPNAYFEFTLAPNVDHKIDFVSFIYKGQISPNGPTLFAFRSSLDGFTANIGTVSAAGSEVSLTAPVFQNIISPITFRLYGWAAATGTGAFSVNNFEFNGIVSCLNPQTPELPETSLGCSSTSFEVNWPTSSNATNYFINVALDLNFINNLTGYQSKQLGNVLSENIPGLNTGGTYYVRLKSGNSCSESSYSNTIKVAVPETIYTGTWSNGTPNASKKARFSSDFNLNADLEACSCQIDNGVAVHIDSGVALRLENGLDVQGLGTLIFENNASLIQTNNTPGINSGDIVYNRISKPMNTYDYTYWSSPVTGAAQTLGALSPYTATGKYYSWGTTDWVVEDQSKVMELGRGYIIQTPQEGTYGAVTINMPYSQPGKFVGVPNNGHYVLPINGKDVYNLIGNPYPSALSADEFLFANASQLYGTIYFWTHNTAMGSDGEYADGDYASYNLTGGVGTGTKATTTPGVSTAPPSGYIAAGQSFFACSNNDPGFTGTVVFDNYMRIGVSGKNSDFFRGTKSKTATLDKHRIWLNLTNKAGVFKQMLVGYTAGATTEGYDSAFDGASFNGNSFVDFYSINENSNLTIQGRALPFDTQDQVPLGYSTIASGTFEIGIDHADGDLANSPVFLEDKAANVIHNLNNGPYSFTTEEGTFDDRFTLRYANKADAALENSTFDQKEKRLVVSVKNHKIKINSFDDNIDKVIVYDLRGSLLYETKQVNGNEFTIPNLNFTHQFLIVKTQLSNGKWVTKEIVF